MSVSNALKNLAMYVTESEGEERVYALCVFTDCALKEGTKDAERFCAEVLSAHLQDAEVGADGDEILDEELKVAKTQARKVTIDQLIETTMRLDRSLDKKLLIKVAKNAIGLLRSEEDDTIRAKLTKLLRILGVPFSKIPSAHLALFAIAEIAARFSLAA